MLLSKLVYISMINVAHKCRLKNGRNEVGMLEKIMAVCKSKWVLGLLVVGVSASAAVAASAAVSGWNGATNMNTVNQVLGQLDGMLTNRENQVKQLKADLKDADATIATLTQQRDAANAKLATAQQDLLAAQQAVTALTSQLNQAKTENDSLRGQLDEKIKEIQQKIADGNRQVELKQQEVDRLSAQVGSLNGQLGNLQNQLTNVTNQYNDLQHASHAQISSLSSEVDDLRNQLRAAEQDAQNTADNAQNVLAKHNNTNI